MGGFLNLLQRVVVDGSGGASVMRRRELSCGRGHYVSSFSAAVTRYEFSFFSDMTEEARDCMCSSFSVFVNATPMPEDSFLYSLSLTRKTHYLFFFFNFKDCF